MPKKLFISHAVADEEHSRHLAAHLSFLRQGGLIIIWTRQMIAPGEDERAVVDRELGVADVIALLVTPDFLTSDSCCREVELAMVRHNARKARVVPILVRSVDVHGTPFGSLTHLPRSGHFITRADDRDEAWCPANHSQHPTSYAADNCASDSCGYEAEREENDPRFQVIDFHISRCHTIYRYRLLSEAL